MAEEPHMLVQKLRVQRGWSQEQLAELTGLSARTIQRIERGQNASAESLKAIAAVFEVDLSALREPDMPTPATSQVSPEEALALKMRFEKLPTVSMVVEAASLVPRDQERKLEQLKDIQFRLRRLPKRGARPSLTCL